MTSLVPCNSPPEAMRRFEGDSEWEPQASLKSSMNPTPSTSEVVGLWLWCTGRPPYNDNLQPACFLPPFFVLQTKKLPCQGLAANHPLNQWEALDVIILWCFRVPNPSFGCRESLLFGCLACWGRPSWPVRVSRCAHVACCAYLCVSPFSWSQRKAYTVAVIMWRIGPKSEHHKLKIFQLFRKTGFPIWNLSWSKTGPTGRALFWSGHCWRHETIFKARAEAKTEGPLGRFRIDSPVMTCHCWVPPPDDGFWSSWKSGGQ